MKQIRFVFLIIIGFLSIAILGLSIFYLNTIYQQRRSETLVIQPDPNKLTIYSNSNSIFPKDFKKRIFDPNRIFSENIQYYPEKFTSLVLSHSENNLKDFKCVKVWSGNKKAGEADYIYRPENTTQNLVVTDKEVLKILEDLNSTVKSDKKFISASVCKVENDSYLVQYELGIPTDFYFAPKEVDNYIVSRDASQIFSIPVLISQTYEGIYYGCGDPFQITKTNISYIECGVGEATTGMSWFYEVDLNKKETRLIAECSYHHGISIYENDSSSMSCK